MRSRTRINTSRVRALDYCIDILGGAPETQREFKLRTVWSVYKWRLDGGLPLKHVNAMVQKVRGKGGEITHHELSPEHYPE